MESRKVKRVSQLGREAFDPGEREDRGVCESSSDHQPGDPGPGPPVCASVGDRRR